MRAYVERVEPDVTSVARLTLARRHAEAEAAIRSPEQWREHVVVRAIMGDVAGAMAVLERETFPRPIGTSVHLVCCVEAFRARDIELAERLLALLEDNWQAAPSVAFGLLGRVPWSIYPFEI